MTLEEMFQKSMQNPEFRKEYEALESEYTVKKVIIQAKVEKECTTSQLAQLIGVDEKLLSDLENWECDPTISQIEQLAEGLGKRLVLKFEEIQTK
ncbi:MAG: helix-turn-helix transcriptional regulator [Eubacteriales bacterium]